MEDSKSPTPPPSSPLVVIVGETASGKSSMAMKLAQKYNGEIISADSWTVYPGFNVGTAKPNTAEMEEIRHYLIDVADPVEGYNAALYKKQAQSAIKDITSRGKIPIMVGGTGLYIDSVVYDYQFLPVGDENDREFYNGMTLELLIEMATKSNIDLSNIDQRNKRRVIRAIESNGQKPRKNSVRPATLILGVKKQKEHLAQRIEKRVDQMIKLGLEHEVSELANKYGWGVEAMKGIGYREWQDYFNSTQTLEQTKERIIRATLGLAKRQRTWFKRNDNIQWCEDYEQSNKLVNDFLNKHLLQ
jgi:tRNA dimethylallyltransferase